MERTFKLYLAIAAIMLSYVTMAGDKIPASAKIDFNRNWSFVKSSAEWAVDFNRENRTMEPVILPHTWNADDMGPGLTNPYIGSGWYMKRFIAPMLQKSQRLLIGFEGVNNCWPVLLFVQPVRRAM